MEQQIKEYTDVIRAGYEKRVAEYRNFLNRKAVQFGDDLMPDDVADIMNKSYYSGKFKHLYANGFESIYGRLLLLIDVYEGCGFSYPEELGGLTREHVQEYF